MYSVIGMICTGETIIFELQRVLHFDHASIHAEGFWQDAYRLQ